MSDERPKDEPIQRQIEACARNVVNQILDEAGTDVPTRQRINDMCDVFAIKLIGALVAAPAAEDVPQTCARPGCGHPIDAHGPSGCWRAGCPCPSLATALNDGRDELHTTWYCKPCGTQQCQRAEDVSQQERCAFKDCREPRASLVHAYATCNQPKHVPELACHPFAADHPVIAPSDGPVPVPYAAVLCKDHGSVDIDEVEYDKQMDRPDSRWMCPRCGGLAEFNDARYEALQGITDPPHEHCEHYQAGAPHPGDEPHGDPGDGLGVEGYCCKCDAVNEAHDEKDCERCAQPSDGHMCGAGKDGECNQTWCPQLRDGEPKRSGRHCPLDRASDERADEAKG